MLCKTQTGRRIEILKLADEFLLAKKPYEEFAKVRFDREQCHNMLDFRFDPEVVVGKSCDVW